MRKTEKSLLTLVRYGHSWTWKKLFGWSDGAESPARVGREDPKKTMAGAVKRDNTFEVSSYKGAGLEGNVRPGQGFVLLLTIECPYVACL